MDQDTYFVCQKKEQGICIIRCYGKESRVVIPKEIEGLPVVEVSAYAFAAQMEEEPKNPGEYPCICGDLLEELILPDTVERIGRYVFYNCWNFRHFSFCSNIRFMGAGAFTGCKKLRELTVRDVGSERSCLREVLVDLNHTVTVFGEGERPYMALYPGFYEEAVENTPARIIETHTHGVGIQYRNTFKNTRIDWDEYDRLFSIGKHNMELSEAVLTAVYRLMTPVHLEENSKKEYIQFLQGKIRETAELCLRLEKRDLLCWLGEQFVQNPEELEEALRAVQGDVEAVSLLMDISHRRFHSRENKRKKGFSL